MSAPVTERARGRTAVAPPRTRPAPSIPAQRGSEGAAGRAYARRDERLRRLTGAPRERTAEPTRRAQFVLLVMGLLATGLVLTLWLSTAAAADSYRLQEARDRAGTLTEQAERLHREVAAAGSATEIANRAAELGMVPVEDPARLVVAPDGTVAVVGEPAVVRPPAPPAPAVPPPGAAPAPVPGAPVDPAAAAAVPPAPADPAAVGPAAVDPAAVAPVEGAPLDGTEPTDGTAPVVPAPVPAEVPAPAAGPATAPQN
jgi:cell division protein FtsI (penicillin-binding protein 3)